MVTNPKVDPTGVEFADPKQDTRRVQDEAAPMTEVQAKKEKLLGVDMELAQVEELVLDVGVF